MNEWVRGKEFNSSSWDERASEWVSMCVREWVRKCVRKWRRDDDIKNCPFLNGHQKNPNIFLEFYLFCGILRELLSCSALNQYMYAAYWRASGKFFRILVIRGPEAWLSKERVSEWWRGGSGCNAWGACLLLGVSLVSEWVSVEWSVEWWKMEDKRRLTCMCVQCIHVVHYYSLLNSCTVEYSRSSVSSAEWVSEWVSE
jgi:hypothetical protein